MIKIAQKPIHSVQITTPEHVVFRELDGEAVLLDLKTQQYFGLNEIGTLVWLALRDGAKLAEIVDTIAAEYDTEAEQVRADVTRLIDELRAAELIEVDDAPAE